MNFIANLIVIVIVLTAVVVYIAAPFLAVGLYVYYTYEPMPLYFVAPMFILWIAIPLAVVATVAGEEE